MRTIVALIAAPVILLFLGVQTVHACSCGGGDVKPCQAYGNAGAVFVGVVTGVERRKIRDVETERGLDAAREHLPSVMYRFAVEEAFGGIEGMEVKIGTGSGGGDCGYRFAEGARYLVYAYAGEHSRILSTSICTPTKPAVEVGDDLKFLRGLASRDPGVTISGAVITAYQTKDGTKPPLDQRVVGLPIIVESEGERRELRTDAEGRYQLAGLKAGAYTIKVVLPDELYTYRAEEKVKVAERGCGSISFYVTDNGRISGRATDTEGQSVARITINALPTGEVEKESPNMHYAQTDEEGNFKFEALPPGRYLLGVRLSKYPQQNDPTNAFPRMYHPGVETAAQAEPVAIGAGEHIKDFALRLAPRRTPRTLRGEVVWSDGRPVKNAHVYFRETTYREEGVDNAISADEEGKFTLNVYDGLTYVFGASSNTRYMGTPERVEPVRITVSDGSVSVRIRIHPPGGTAPQR